MRATPYELHRIITADGDFYDLNDNGLRATLLYPTNAAMPAIRWITDTAYQQYGVTERGYDLEQRVLTLNIRYSGESREDYYAARAGLINVMRPNRLSGVSPLTYVFIRGDGSRRALTARSNSPTFQEVNTEEADEFGYSEVVELLGFDPIWFDPSINALEFEAFEGSEQLVFPIVFPIYFDASGFNELDITYAGTWFSYPTLTISGRCDNWQLQNLTTGKNIIYPRAMDAADTLTLDLVNRTLTDGNGNNLWGYLDPSSDIMSFRIEPAEIVDGGVNQLKLLSASAVDVSAVISYYTRYIGI